jgi:ABC-type sulfate transport system permease component
LVAVATLGVASIPIAWSGASAPFDLGEFIRGLIDAAAFFVFPVLVAAFAITMGIERAGT